MAGALGVEINVLPVRGIFGAIVETLRSGETSFVAAGDRNCVDVEIAIALANEGESLAIRRPAMPIRRSVLRDAARRAAGNRNDIHQGIMCGTSGRRFRLHRIVADGEQRGIRRDAVIIVDATGNASVHGFRRAASDRQLLYVTIAIEK